MANLNLLPLKKQRHIYLTKLFKILQKELLIISLILFSFIAVLKIGQLFLQTELKNLKINMNQQKQKYQNLDHEITVLNQNLMIYDKINQKTTSLSSLFSELNQQLENKIYLNQIIVEQKEEEGLIKFTVEGFYETRPDFLNFIRNLENSAIFSDFNSPLENLVQAENGEFTIYFNYKLVVS